MAVSRLHVDEEGLISAVQERPCIWDGRDVSYEDRNMKNKAWDEVCEIVIENWENMSRNQKSVKLKQVQTRWRSLKDCYSRDLRNMRELERSGSSPTQKKQYLYFEQLDFLRPVLEARSTSGNLIRTSGQEQDHDSSDIPHETSGEQPAASTAEGQTHTRGRRKRQQEQSFPLAGQLNSLLDERKSLMDDINYHFGMYTFTYLKKLDLESMDACRTEVWNVLHKYKIKGKQTQEKQSSQTLTSNITSTPIASNTPIHYYPGPPTQYHSSYSAHPNSNIQFNPIHHESQTQHHHAYTHQYHATQFHLQNQPFQNQYPGAGQNPNPPTANIYQPNLGQPYVQPPQFQQTENVTTQQSVVQHHQWRQAHNQEPRPPSNRYSCPPSQSTVSALPTRTPSIRSTPEPDLGNFSD